MKHDLDDLIIDDIDAKRSKSKSLLTIIALALLILIMGIILSKYLLGEGTRQEQPKAISSYIDKEALGLEAVEEKTVQAKPHEAKNTDTPTATKKTEESKQGTQKRVESLAQKVQKNKAEAKQKGERKEKIPVVPITDEFAQVPEKSSSKSKATPHKATAATPKLTPHHPTPAKKSAKTATQKQKPAKKQSNPAKARVVHDEKSTVEKKKRPEKIARKNETSKTQQNYYIQVGSFTGEPGTTFLTIIRNSGYDYRVTAPDATGLKHLLLGPYPDRSSAERTLVRVRDRINKHAFIYTTQGAK